MKISGAGIVHQARRFFEIFLSVQPTMRHRAARQEFFQSATCARPAMSDHAKNFSGLTTDCITVPQQRSQHGNNPLVGWAPWPCQTAMKNAVIERPCDLRLFTRGQQHAFGVGVGLHRSAQEFNARHFSEPFRNGKQGHRIIAEVSFPERPQGFHVGRFEGDPVTRSVRFEQILLNRAEQIRMIGKILEYEQRRFPHCHEITLCVGLSNIQEKSLSYDH